MALLMLGLCTATASCCFLPAARTSRRGRVLAATMTAATFAVLLAPSSLVQLLCGSALVITAMAMALPRRRARPTLSEAHRSIGVIVMGGLLLTSGPHTAQHAGGHAELEWVAIISGLYAGWTLIDAIVTARKRPPLPARLEQLGMAIMVTLMAFTM